MSSLYQQLDAPMFDYSLATLADVPEHALRGPLPNLNEPYVAFVGGAQTFARFVAEPFANLVAKHLGLGCLNLGLGGAGPRWPADARVLPILQRAKLVVVQCFAGRSASNSLFDNGSTGRNSGRYLFTGDCLTYEQFLDEVMARQDLSLLQRVVRETRDDYACSMRHLGHCLSVPTVLLWLGRRRPEYTIDWRHRHGILNHFPQLLDRAVVDRVRPFFRGYVECASEQGLPQRLWPAVQAVDGTVLGADGYLRNEYYPSPEMHQQAADLLLPVCRQVLADAAL